jgi:hypothetical protein
MRGQNQFQSHSPDTAKLLRLRINHDTFFDWRIAGSHHSFHAFYFYHAQFTAPLRGKIGVKAKMGYIDISGKRRLYYCLALPSFNHFSVYCKTDLLHT